MQQLKVKIRDNRRGGRSHKKSSPSSQRCVTRLPSASSRAHSLFTPQLKSRLNSSSVLSRSQPNKSTYISQSGLKLSENTCCVNGRLLVVQASHQPISGRIHHVHRYVHVTPSAVMPPRAEGEPMIESNKLFFWTPLRRPLRGGGKGARAHALLDGGGRGGRRGCLFYIPFSPHSYHDPLPVSSRLFRCIHLLTANT